MLKTPVVKRNHYSPSYPIDYQGERTLELEAEDCPLQNLQNLTRNKRRAKNAAVIGGAIIVTTAIGAVILATGGTAAAPAAAASTAAGEASTATAIATTGWLASIGAGFASLKASFIAGIPYSVSGAFALSVSKEVLDSEDPLKQAMAKAGS